MSLRGMRVLVTRAADQAGELAALIRERGGVPVLFPTIRLVPPEDRAPLDAALDDLAAYDWILFTSANAVRFFCERARERGIVGLPEGVRAASVGPGTSREMARRGIPVALEAATHTAEGLAAALARDRVAGRRFLFPRALEGREALAGALARLGGSVVEVVAYRTGLPDLGDEAAETIVARPPEVCTFASPSAFRNFFRLLGEEAAAAVLAASRIAVIGEVTARAVAERNFAVDIMPERYTLSEMVEAIDSRLGR